MNLSNCGYHPERLINVFNELETGGRCMEFCATGPGKASLETKLIWIFLWRRGEGSRKKEPVGIEYAECLGFFFQTFWFNPCVCTHMYTHITLGSWWKLCGISPEIFAYIPWMCLRMSKRFQHLARSLSIVSSIHGPQLKNHWCSTRQTQEWVGLYHAW